MSNISKYAVTQTSRLHFTSADDELLYDDGANGPDKSKPMAANLYGPGSKQYGKAQAAQQNRLLDKLKKKGKTSQTADEKLEEQAEFLAECTESFENITESDLVGRELFKAIYMDREIGFIAEQVAKHIGEWGNFTKGSTMS